MAAINPAPLSVPNPPVPTQKIKSILDHEEENVPGQVRSTALNLQQNRQLLRTWGSMPSSLSLTWALVMWGIGLIHCISLLRSRCLLVSPLSVLAAATAAAALIVIDHVNRVASCRRLT